MRMGILACDILKNEIEHLVENDPDVVHKEYLEFALHADPDNMRDIILEKANALKDQVDVLFLGYATCCSLGGIDKEIEVPTVMLPGADCIDALLGPDEYKAEKKVCTGTWFSTPGWAVEGIDGLVKEMHLDSMEGFEPSFFLDLIFQSYDRVLFIDTGVGDAEEFRRMSEDFASELKLKHDCRTCGLDRIADTIERARELGRSIIRRGCSNVLHTNHQ